MLQILAGSEHSKNSALFTQLFQLRHEIFIKRRSWALPSKKGVEIDQYDDESAYYLIHTDDNGDIEMTLRLTPTMTSSLMADYFPHLNESKRNIRSPFIYEATRYICLPRKRDPSYQRHLKSRFFAAMVEWSLDEELSHLQSVIDAASLKTFVEMSLRTHPLGLPHPFGGGPNVKGGGECLGFEWEVCQELIDDLIFYGDKDESTALATISAPLGEIH